MYPVRKEEVTLRRATERAPDRKGGVFFTAGRPNYVRSPALSLVITICSLPLLLISGFPLFVMPFWKGPVDAGGLSCLGPSFGVVLAMFGHGVAVWSGRRLRIWWWLASPFLSVGVAALIMGLMK